MSARAVELAKASSLVQNLLNQIGRVTDTIAEVGSSKALSEKLVSLEHKRDELLWREAALRQEQPEECPLPPVAEIKRLARELMATRAAALPEFNRIMKRLVPSIKVFPYRLCDGGAVVLRAKLVIDLTALVTNSSICGEMGGILRRQRTVDLFEPPQREKFRKQVVALRKTGLTERKIAAQLRLTVTATQKAAALQWIMDQRGLTDPYVQVTEPPDDCTKLRRHLHPRYRFEPLPEDDVTE